MYNNVLFVCLLFVCLFVCLLASPLYNKVQRTKDGLIHGCF